jgi:hypothetical protein
VPNLMSILLCIYRVRQKDIPYLERALCELWWGYGGGGGIDRLRLKCHLQ